MLTKNKAKFIKSLQLKKYRQKEGLFIVEGEKNVLELLGSTFEVRTILGSPTFMEVHQSIINSKNAELLEVSASDLSSVGTFKTNDKALAVVRIPDEKKYETGGVQLILDDVRDPGNLGTIIRVADWYGINSIICSETTAELFNPKTINSSMGSIFRVNVFRRNIVNFLSEHEATVYGALLSGANVHQIKFDKNAFVIIGNEANGISEHVLPFITQAVTIPRLGQAESLNAAMATAIICDNIFRES